MSNMPKTYTSTTVDPESEKIWIEYARLLRVNARRFVHSANVGRWYYQKEEIVEDVVQETIRRFIERSQRAECGELPSICSPKHVMIRIAHNYCIDMWRKDCRLQLTFSGGDTQEAGETSSAQNDQSSLLDAAVEHVYREELFTHLAWEVARFPAKQSEALLVDLASRMHFDAQLTPLQSAFKAEGMDLQAHQLSLPKDLDERARHNALVSLAYKRVTTCMRKYIVEKSDEA